MLSERGWGVRRIAGHLGIGVGEASRILSGESWAVVKEEMLTGTRPGD